MSIAANYMKNRYENMKIGMILLAAGYSRRFGSNKLLYEIEGRPMYLRTLDQLIQAGKELAEDKKENKRKEKNSRPQKQALVLETAVVTQYQEIKEAAKSQGVTVLINHHPEKGISSSLKTGLEYFKDTDACLFAVADQPWLTSGTIAGLVSLFLKSGKGIACVSKEKQPGNPCIFTRKYYPQLMALTGDKGGKRVLNAHLEDTAFFEAADSRETADMDFQESFASEQ